MTRVQLRDGHDGPFSQWHAALTREVSSQDGFLNVDILPTYAGAAEWQIIQRFASPTALERWLANPRRKDLLAELAELKDPDASSPSEEIAPDYHAFDTVTEAITTVVEAGRESEFLAWTQEMQCAQARFPGYMGTFVQAPVTGDPPCWTALVRFSSPELLDAWLSSPERRTLLDKADPAVSHWSSRRLSAGFGGWFDTNSKGASPPAWKQTALVLLVLFPVVMLEIRFLSPYLAGLPMAVGTFIGNAISVGLVSWPLVGLAQAGMKWWLNPPAAHKWRNEIGGAALLIALYAAEMGLLSLLF